MSLSFARIMLSCRLDNRFYITHLTIITGMLDNVPKADKTKTKTKPKTKDTAGSDKTPEIDLSGILSTIGNLMGQMGTSGGKRQDKNAPNLDLPGLLSSFGTLMGGQGGGNQPNLLTLAPMLLSTVNSFIGPEALERAKEHEDHAWLMPPIIEKIHLLFDHFMNSELGRVIVDKIAGEKFIKTFKDENGRFQYSKFTELLENQSFRRHWIKMVASRASDFIVYISDPKTVKGYVRLLNF